MRPAPAPTHLRVPIPLLWVVASLLVVVAGCEKSPVAPAGSVTVTAPVSTSPANGATIANGAQPVTLVVSNAVVTSAGADVTYTFEVATDTTFGTVTTRKSVAQGSGSTSATLDPLPAGRTYYWRVRATGNDTAGPFTAPVSFTIGAAVTLGTPAAVRPLTGAVADQTPTLTVANVTRTGATGPLFYRFEIATSPTFTTLVSSGTVAEGDGTTSFTPATSLPADTAFYWRAQAVDPANSATGTFSSAQMFSTVLSIDLRTVNFQRFVNVTAWPVTDRILGVDQDGGDGHMCIDHEKRGLWPAVSFLGDPDAQIEANQWYFARINGQWYAGSGEWVRPGQICKVGQTSAEIGKDGTWGGPMDSWIPKRGELVGYMMTTPARYWPDMQTLDERSNVVVLPWVVDGSSAP